MQQGSEPRSEAGGGGVMLWLPLAFAAVVLA